MIKSLESSDDNRSQKGEYIESCDTMISSGITTDTKYDDEVYSNRSYHYYTSRFIVIGRGRNLLHSILFLSLSMIIKWCILYIDCEEIFITKHIRWMCNLHFILTLCIVFINPGYFKRIKMDRIQVERLKLEDKIYCMDCLTLNSDGVKHCNFCRSCVKHLDHHCDVFGNCIGRTNILCFYPAVVLGFIVLIFVMAGLQNNVNKCFADNNK